jgi:Gram-negative bacterial TonB protein C-terminal
MRVTKDCAQVTLVARPKAPSPHIISHMGSLRSLVLVATAVATFAGIPAQGLDAARLVPTPAVATPHPKRVGGAVSAPALIHVVDMRGLKHIDSGVVLSLWVGTDGVPSHIRVLQGGDSTQNEKIIAAVEQYRFSPAMENGKPVLVEMDLQLDID